MASVNVVAAVEETVSWRRAAHTAEPCEKKTPAKMERDDAT